MPLGKLKRQNDRTTKGNASQPSSDDEIRFEWLRPFSLAERRKKANIAFLPLGALEWHGPQNPLGLDALKAHHICCMAARELGGVVFPPLVWGLPRDSFFVDTNDLAGNDTPGKIAAACGTTRESILPPTPHGGMDMQEQWIFYQRLLRMSLEQITGFGFQSIYILTGHGPLTHWVRPVALAMARASRMTGNPINIDWGGEADAPGLRSDHAGKWETSLMMAIAPNSVDLSELEARPDYRGLGANPNALESSVQQGEEWLRLSATAIAKEARWLVEHYPDLPTRHTHAR